MTAPRLPARPRWLTMLAIALPTLVVAGVLGLARPHPARPPARLQAQAAATRAPGPVRGLVGWPGQGHVTLAWAPPSDPGSPAADHFGVLMHDGPTLVSALDATASPFVVADLVDGQVRGYLVVASSSAGVGPDSGPMLRLAPSTTPYAPLGSWSSWVDLAFSRLLGRSPSASERGSWTAQLAAGTQIPPTLVASIRGGTDHRTNVDPVTRLYRAYFLRTPDVGGLRHWIAKRRAGASLTAISDGFARSREFTNRYGALGNRAFVELIYANLFGRAGDPTGVAYWTRKLDARLKTRGQVMVGFSESSEFVRKQAMNVEVAVQTILLLGRAPTPLEVEGAASSAATPTALAATLLRSPELSR